jgi:hypothetical protein
LGQEILPIISGWWFGTLFFDFPFSWECHHPNWRTQIFERGWLKPPTSKVLFVNYTNDRVCLPLIIMDIPLKICV